MQVGEVVTVTTPMKRIHFQRYVIDRGDVLRRRFTTLWLGDNRYEIRRIDGLPDEDKLAKARSRSATLMHERRRSRT